MKLKEITFINDQAKYVTPSWDKLDKLTLKVAKLVQKSGINFDLIVALAKEPGQ
jgi:hypoxanthine phosphoribosyltransferase